jgi:hypothetical protein
VGILAVAAAGLVLFGTGVRGLTQIDDELATATERPTAHQVRHEIDLRRDCPWRDERQL